MSQTTPFPDLQATREQAALWIARRERGLAADERPEFERWIRKPGHARIYQQLDSIWNEMDMLEALAQLVPEPPSESSSHRGIPRRHAIAATVAVLAVAVSAATLWRGGAPAPHSKPEPPRVEAYATAVGEHRSVNLADGSVLNLNTNTLIEVSLSGATRELRLVRGEAHFAVAHDATHPFRVTAQGRLVQAVGTAFDVRIRSRQELDVLVTEGTVSVDDAPATDERISEMKPVRVQAGEQLRVDARGHPSLRTLGSREIENSMAWRDGRLVFDGESLQQVLDEFSRYTADRFEIPDSSLRAIRIGGYFPAGDTQTLQSILESGFGLVLKRQPTGALRVDRARREPARKTPN